MTANKTATVKGLIIAFILVFWMAGCSELQISYQLGECISKELMNTKECEMTQTMRNVLNLIYMLIIAVVVSSLLFVAVKNRPKN